jgi:hypothetical protein
VEGNSTTVRAILVGTDLVTVSDGTSVIKPGGHKKWWQR